MTDKLRRHAARLGLSDRIEWRGALTQAELLDEYRAADIFALASRVAHDGDRDGLPNVLMEAQTQGLPCVATNVSAIPEFIIHERTGILVPPESPDTLAEALRALISNPERRQRLGEAGRERVNAEFSMEKGIDRLAEKFGIAV